MTESPNPNPSPEPNADASAPNPSPSPEPNADASAPASTEALVDNKLPIEAMEIPELFALSQELSESSIAIGTELGLEMIVESEHAAKFGGVHAVTAEMHSNRRRLLVEVGNVFMRLAAVNLVLQKKLVAAAEAEQAPILGPDGQPTNRDAPAIITP